MKDRARIKTPVRTYSAPAVDRTLDILEFMAVHPRPLRRDRALPMPEHPDQFRVPHSEEAH